MTEQSLGAIDVDELTPEEIAVLRDYLLLSFDAFFEFLFGYEVAKHQTEWAMIVDGRAAQTHVCARRLADKPNAICECPLTFHEDYDAPRWKQLVLMAPRNHSKTAMFSVAYPLWLIAKNSKIRIILVSNTSTQAESFLRQITTTLETNDRYIKVFGNLVPAMPDKWTQKEIIVERNAPELKDPTVSATGTGGAILSKRADVIICDDLLNSQNTRTSMQRQFTRDWFMEVLKPVLEPTGQMIVVGTAWHKKDLYHELMRMRTYQIRRRYDAIVDEEKKQVLWKERWSWKKLQEELEEMGSSSFNKAYRNLVSDKATQVFKDAPLERAMDRGRTRTLIYQLDYSQWDLGGMTVSMGVDLAISERQESDDCGFAVIGRLRNGEKIPLHLSLHKLGFADQQKMILDLYRRFQPEIIIVESNGYQAALKRDMAENSDLPIEGYNTGGEKYDEEIGLNSLAVEFENDKWTLPCSSNSPHSVKMTNTLVEAMKAFPDGHTHDLLMALWFANTGMRKLVYTDRGQAHATGSTNDVLGR